MTPANGSFGPAGAFKFSASSISAPFNSQSSFSAGLPAVSVLLSSRIPVLLTADSPLSSYLSTVFQTFHPPSDPTP